MHLLERRAVATIPFAIDGGDEQLLVALLLLTAPAHADNEAFVGAMQKDLALFDAAKTPVDFEAASGAFARSDPRAGRQR
jgi:hypothetical protein